MADRIPPHNTNAEQAVLGAMLLDKEAIAKAIEKINKEMFYHETHSMIFDAIVFLYEKNQPADLITVTDFLRKNQTLDKVGGLAYLNDILDALPTSANVEYYLNILEETAVLRNLLGAGSQIVALAFDAENDASSTLEQAERLIFDLAKNRENKAFIGLKNILLPVMQQIEDAYGKEELITGVPSGFSELDYYTSGFQKSDLIIMAARPSMGKTSLALNIAANASIRHGIPTAIFSLEMSKEQLAFRLLCSESGIDSHRLKTGGLKEHEWKSVTRSLGKLSEASIFIDDSAALNTLEIKAKARRLLLEHNIGLILIDYLQLLQSSRRSENRTQEISEISRALKALSRELSVPVIALSQLSRSVEQRIDKRPRLSDLRESGEIEQTADIVMFIHRDDYYDQNSENANLAQIIIAKHRNGPTGHIDLVFKKELTKFASKERADLD